MTPCASGVRIDTLDLAASYEPPASHAFYVEKQFSPEFALLIACVAPVNAARMVVIRDLQSIANWPEFLQTVHHHRLIPQVYNTFCSRELGDAIPTEIFEELRRLYYINARQTLRLTRDLIGVVRHFESRKIPVLAYKGPALAAHQGNSDRQFSDIDLVVHPADARKAKAALLELGYTTERYFSASHEKAHLKSGYECPFDLPDAKHSLELKWRMVPKFYSIDFDISGFFDRSINVEISGHSIRTLGPEDTLLVLCVHAAKHAWSELSLLWDVAKLIESQSIDWVSVGEQAKQLGIQRIVQTNLALAQKHWGATHGPSREFFDQRLPRSIDLNDRSMDNESLRYFYFILSLRERWRDQARFLTRLILTPGEGEWNSVHLPRFLSPLYGVVRIYRLGYRLLGDFASQSKFDPLSPP